jgi:hypothetical protein
MGRSLSTDSGGNSILVNVRGEKGQVFIGKLLASKTVESKYKTDSGEPKLYNIYTFAVEDTTMETQRKEGKEYKNVDIEPGTTVDLFAPTRLNNALRQAEIGWRIKIEYLGLGKATGKGGKPHTYSVEVL